MRAIDQVLALRDVEAYGTYSSEIVKTPKISRARLAKIHFIIDDCTKSEGYSIFA